MKAILDADSIPFIAGWVAREKVFSSENYQEVIKITDAFMQNILTSCNATHFAGFLGTKSPTFRHMMNSEYKANRDQNKAEYTGTWQPVITHRLINHWGLIQVQGMEAEDAVSMLAYYLTAAREPHVICHIDKDLDQIPGEHYNYRNFAKYSLTPDEALKKLYVQAIMGDKTDNIPGIEGIGPVKAQAILDKVSPPNYMEITIQAFIKKYGQRVGILKFAESYAMVKLLAEPEMGFQPDQIPWMFYDKPVTDNIENTTQENYNPFNT